MKKAIMMVMLLLLSFLPREGMCSYSWANLADFKGIDQFAIFLTGNFKFSNGEIKGRVAVKGDAYLNKFAIGKNARKTDYTLIVNGNLYAGGSGNNDGGNIYNGGVYAGSSATIEKVTIHESQSQLSSKGDISLKNLSLPVNVKTEGNVTVEHFNLTGNIDANKNITVKYGKVDGDVNAGGNATIQYARVEGNVNAAGNINISNASVGGNQGHSYTPITVNSPFDFDSVNLSDIANELYKDGTDIGITYGKIAINITDPGTYYFDISATDFAGNWGLFSINAPAGSTVVIDIIDDPDDIPLVNKDFQISGGITTDDIIFNFMDEDGNLSIDIKDSSPIFGSILAPNGDLELNNGSVEGSIMADSLVPPAGLDSNAQLIGAVPIPSSLFLLLSTTGLFLLVVNRNVILS